MNVYVQHEDGKWYPEQRETHEAEYVKPDPNDGEDTRFIDKDGRLCHRDHTGRSM